MQCPPSEAWTPVVVFPHGLVGSDGSWGRWWWRDLGDGRHRRWVPAKALTHSVSAAFPHPWHISRLRRPGFLGSVLHDQHLWGSGGRSGAQVCYSPRAESFLPRRGTSECLPCPRRVQARCKRVHVCRQRGSPVWNLGTRAELPRSRCPLPCFPPVKENHS